MNNFVRTCFCSKFKNKFKTIPTSAEGQSLKISIKVVNEQQQALHNLFLRFCFMHIHLQLRLLAAAREEKTSCSLFNKLA